MDVPRKVYYEKELEMRLSRSYGPGRYDYGYEEAGNDYPYGYVRWTENRNMQAFLELISSGKVDISSLITHRFDVDKADAAYELISMKTTEIILGVVLNYPEKTANRNHEVPNVIPKSVAPKNRLQVGIGFVGAGGFASGVLLPLIKSISSLRPVSIMSGSGVSAVTSAEVFGFDRTSSSYEQMLIDKNINALFIANRHNQHAEFVMNALKAQKPVFVEKPLCLKTEELTEIVGEYKKNPIPLMVGFNRRFAPLVRKMKTELAEVKYPLSIHYRINAGFIPDNNWIQDKESGGGRIIGEVCHFVDLLCYLTGATPTKITAESLAMPDETYRSDDNLQMMLRFADGSVGTINYVASGNKLMPKEYLEIFGGGTAMKMDDFKTLSIAGKKGLTMDKAKSQDKGHQAMLEAWAECLVKGSESPIPFSEIITTTQATFDITSSLQKGEAIWTGN
jgi:polar amino acid transport system substrate-binding protein